MNHAPCGIAALIAALAAAPAPTLCAQQPPSARVALEKHALAAARQHNLALAEAVVRAGEAGSLELELRTRPTKHEASLHLAMATVDVVEGDAELALRLASFELTQATDTETAAPTGRARLVLRFAPRPTKPPARGEPDRDAENAILVRAALAALQAIEAHDGEPADLAPEIASLAVLPAKSVSPGIDVLLHVRGEAFRQHADVVDAALRKAALAKASGLGVLAPAREKVLRDEVGARYTFHCSRPAAEGR
ncbi:MAG TPA: hypothetical protein VFZ65_10300 [Planctomycetota bacterium]|nr:hypothetical protein [Planctomycetota bacterium]